MSAEIYLTPTCVSHGGKGWRHREQDKCRGEAIVTQVTLHASTHRHSASKGDGPVLGWGKSARVVSIKTQWAPSSTASEPGWESTDDTSGGRGDLSPRGICRDHLCSEWTQWPKYQASSAHILLKEVTGGGGMLWRWSGHVSGCRGHWALPAALSSSDGRAEVQQLHKKGNSRVQPFTKQARYPWTLPRPGRRNLRRAGVPLDPLGMMLYCWCDLFLSTGWYMGMKHGLQDLGTIRGGTHQLTIILLWSCCLDKFIWLYYYRNFKHIQKWRTQYNEAPCTITQASKIITTWPILFHLSHFLLILFWGKYLILYHFCP